MNVDPVRSMMVALPVATVGVMLAIAAGMLRAPRLQVRWIGVIFSLAVAAYAIKFWNDEVHILPDFVVFLRLLLGAGAVGWFWLFVIALFEDSPRIGPGLFATVGGLILACVAATYAAGPYHAWLWLLAYLIQIVLALHALAIIVRGWKGDLVEVRRRLRGPFLVTVAGYIVAMRSVDILETFGITPGWHPLTNDVVRFAVCLAGAIVFLESRGELFGPPERVRVGAGAPNGNGGADPGGVDRAAKADLDRLNALMATQQIWREEGLTIASLAVKVSMPEARLRKLINDRLGYRNFPSFVNAHRIAAARARLSDPNEARTSISTIAFDIGFASLGPFNRAFREETGIAPSEWRRKSLTGPGEGSENP
jgi:AraC-like DNA-binding protein